MRDGVREGRGEGSVWFICLVAQGGEEGKGRRGGVSDGFLLSRACLVRMVEVLVAKTRRWVSCVQL